jgi:hypothetical protein
MGPNISVELGGAGGLGPALHLQFGAFQESHADQENDELIDRHHHVDFVYDGSPRSVQEPSQHRRVDLLASGEDDSGVGSRRAEVERGGQGATRCTGQNEAVFRHRWVIHRKTEVPTRQPRPRLVFNTNRDPTVNRSWGEQEGWGLFIGLLPARVLISCRL